MHGATDECATFVASGIGTGHTTTTRFFPEPVDASTRRALRTDVGQRRVRHEGDVSKEGPANALRDPPATRRAHPALDSEMEDTVIIGSSVRLRSSADMGSKSRSSRFTRSSP